jgi:hypothetical protein
MAETPNVDELLEIVRKDGRICPRAMHWTTLYEMLPGRTKLPDGAWEPPGPLILAAWWTSTNDEKRARVAEHIRYAAEQGVLPAAAAFLRGLPESEWVYDRDRPRSFRSDGTAI